MPSTSRNTFMDKLWKQQTLTSFLHRHLREIDCSLAIVGGSAAALNVGANQYTLPTYSTKKVLHSSWCGWQHYYCQQRQAGRANEQSTSLKCLWFYLHQRTLIIGRVSLYSFTGFDSTASLHTNNHIFSFFGKSNLVKLETCCTVILTPTVSVLCPYYSLVWLLLLLSLLYIP